MSDTTTSKEKKPLKLSRPGRLELKKTVATGQVRQSFSHGRSKTVTVEVKRKRTFAPGAEGRMTEVVAPPAEAEQPPAESALEVLEKDVETSAETVRHLTDTERASRFRALEVAKHEEEQRRIQEALESERRAQEAAEAARRAEEEAKEQAKAESEVAAEAQPAEPEPGEVEAPEAEPKRRVATAEAQPAPKPAIEEELGGRVKRKTAAPKPGPTRRGERRRRHGKLTISQALAGFGAPTPREAACRPGKAGTPTPAESDPGRRRARGDHGPGVGQPHG